MRHFLFGAAIVCAVPLFSQPSLADRAAADACAANLTPDAKLVYAATITLVTPDGDLKEIVRAKTRSLVTSGKLSRGAARAAAEAAGPCLKQAR